MSDSNSSTKGPGAIISILTWFLTVTMFLSVAVQLSFRISSRRFRVKDDATMSVAAIFMIAQCIATSFAAAEGLGEPVQSLTTKKVDTVLKSIYVADVFFLPTLCAAEGSALFLIESIPASKLVKKMVRWLNFSNIAWCSAATVALIFRSSPPTVWTLPANDINLYDFWFVTSIFSIIVELLAIVIPTLVILPLQTSMSRRSTVLVTFFFRLFVVVALAMRLYYVPRSKELAEDATKDLASQIIATQFTLSAAIVATSIPVLSHFLDHFDTGQLRMQDTQACGSSGNGYFGSNNIPLSNRSNRSTKKEASVNIRSHLGDSPIEADEENGVFPNPHDQSGTTSERTRKSRRGSNSSDTNVILKTVTWDCEYDVRDTHSAASSD